MPCYKILLKSHIKRLICKKERRILMEKLMKNKMAVIVIAIVVCVAVALVGILLFGKSDEDKILQTLDKFTAAYNDGNVIEMAEYMDSRSKNMLEAANGIGSQLLGLDIDKLMSLALGVVGTSAEDGIMKMDVKSIDVSGDTAEVKAIVRLDFSNPYGEEPIETGMTINMAKEEGKWLVAVLDK